MKQGEASMPSREEAHGRNDAVDSPKKDRLQ